MQYIVKQTKMIVVNAPVPGDAADFARAFFEDKTYEGTAMLAGGPRIIKLEVEENV